ncbi:DUF5924 family protein [Salinicola halimionae]|uniref:DUF5924 family protein n=1 Tax=Salinicola halimionae TaxID=1949081 RepID=UPI000DA17732|nr:DUF5924 family protein [Salinicola halimionae]
MRSTLARLEPLVARLRRYHWVWPPIAFVLGLLGFFLVNRQQWLGGLLALGLVLTWVLLIVESIASKWLSRRGRNAALPRAAATFIAQMVHQETLFFCLPFFLATTIWTSGQAIFTGLLIVCSILAILDPLYFGLSNRHRWLYFLLHALCVFVVMLVTLPIMLSLTTGQSLMLSILAMMFFSLPSVLGLLKPSGITRWLAMVGLLVVLGGIAWTGRTWIPPATLWLSGSALSPGFDTAAREPTGSMTLTPQALKSRGLYVYTSIRAPRGLREKIYHVWRHDNEVVERIALIIRGGRDEGYRAWTHKQNFSGTVEGRWQVDVVTQTGQRIGSVRFTVSDDANATLAGGNIQRPPGIPGWNIRHLLGHDEEKDD